jgi:hypothetical protein
MLDGRVIEGLLPTSQAGAMRKTEVHGLYPGWPVFKEKLDGPFVLLGVIGACGIDEHAIRLEDVEGPKEQRSLEHQQAGPRPNGSGESPLDAGPERSLRRAGHVNEHPVEAAMEGELLAGVTGNDRVCNPESLKVGGQGSNPGRTAVISHHDPSVFHELGKK